MGDYAKCSRRETSRKTPFAYTGTAFLFVFVYFLSFFGVGLGVGVVDVVNSCGISWLLRVKGCILKLFLEC